MTLRRSMTVSCVTVILLLLTPPLRAEVFWLSEPGYCDADYAVIEDDEVMHLTGRGIRTHSFSCEWSEAAAQEILNGKVYVTTRARCSNATGTWAADLEIVRQTDDTLRVFQSSGGLSPVRFYPCASG